MSEKGDVSVDTVSLPPTYAPSEAYSDSPPPAYKRAKSTTVQVARMICITLLAAAFMIGFFTLTSNYLSAKECDCHHSGHQHGGFHSASVLPQVEKLVGEESLNKVEEMNGNGLEGSNEASLPNDLFQKEIEEIAVPDVQEELDDNIPEEEVEALVEEVAELEEAERELEEEIEVQDIMQEQLDEMKKKVKLPIDLILGNPSLAGRDVNCEVERRQQPIGGGIVTQAIIVTCSDNDDDDDETDGPGIVVSPPGPRRLGPPLSLLAPIMKMLSAKAMARAERPIEIKTMGGPLSFPFSSGPRPCSPNGPFPCFINQGKSLGPFPGPMNGPNNGPFSSPNNGPFPGPMNGPFSGPNNGPFSGPNNGPFSGPNNGPFSDPNNGPFSGPNNGPFSGPNNGPFSGPNNGPFSGPNNGPFSGPNNGPFSGPNNGPFSGPNNGPFPVNNILPVSFNGPMPNPFNGPFPGPNGPFPQANGPFPGPRPGPNPGLISRHINIPFNGPKSNALPNPFQRPPPSLSNDPIPSGPKSFRQGPMIIENKVDNEPRNRMLPFALRPLVRVSPRMPRILAFATNPDKQGPQTPISSLQRGAINNSPRDPKIMPANLHPLPEAQGRALPSPVALPGLRLLPARLLSAPAFMRGLRRVDSGPITHMELRRPAPKDEVPDFEPRFPDFGPPRVHTVISPNQPKIFSQIPPATPPRFGQLSPAEIVSKIIEINSRPIPKDIMSPPKPIAVIHKAQPIAGRQIPIFPPPPPPPPSSISLPPPPKMDPMGRSGQIPNFNPDAEIIVHSDHPPQPLPGFQPPQLITKEAIVERPQQTEDDRKHHLLIVN